MFQQKTTINLRKASMSYKHEFCVITTLQRLALKFSRIGLKVIIEGRDKWRDSVWKDSKIDFKSRTTASIGFNFLLEVIAFFQIKTNVHSRQYLSKMCVKMSSGTFVILKTATTRLVRQA